MKRKLILTTCAWGPWHMSAWLEMMLPTLLAQGNLPSLVRDFDVTYRIMTNQAGYYAIEASPLMKRVKELCALEIVLPESDTPLHFNHHVQWFQQQAVYAKEQCALLAFLPPDVLWSNCALGNMGNALRKGYAGIAIPHFRANDETARAALIFMPRRADGSLDIAPGELVRFGAKHMHPLSAAAMDCSRTGRLALEMMWRIPNEGFILRQGNRELLALDPSRIGMTQIFYAGDGATTENIYICTDSDDMFMLSIHPIVRDLNLYIQDHPVGGTDIAIQMLHPQNDTPLDGWVASKSMRLHYGPMNEIKWRAAEMKSDVVMKMATEIWATLKRINGDEYKREVQTRTTETAAMPVMRQVIEDYARAGGATDPVPACLDYWESRTAKVAHG